MDNCYICGRYAPLDRHHIFEGTKRKVSEKYGLVIHICRDCHTAVHLHPKEYEWLKKEAQVKAMLDNGWSTDEFIERFGKSYV